MLLKIFAFSIFKMEAKAKSCNSSWGVFIAALFAVLLGSILVNLWIRVLNNFTYQTLGLNPDSTLWSLLIALCASGILVLYIFVVLDDDTSAKIQQKVTGVAFGAASNAANGTIDDGLMGGAGMDDYHSLSKSDETDEFSNNEDKSN
jgi:hypothetical protein